MKNKMFSGIMPALITPIHDDGTLNRAAANAVIDYELGFPIKGFYINGATGEGPILPEKTRREMAELAVEKVRGKGVIINHIGAADTQSAIALAKHAAQIRCDAISSVLPNFFFKYPMDLILDYYKRISDASGLPILVYANGLFNVDAVDFMREAMKIPGIIGLKYTLYDYFGLHRICELNDGNINVINGPDETLICGLVMGADGGIGTTYNIMADWFCQLYEAFQNGQIEKAREIQFKINRVIEVLSRHSTVPAVKEYFKLIGIDVGNVAYPGKVFTSEQSEALLRDLRGAGIQGV